MGFLLPPCVILQQKQMRDTSNVARILQKCKLKTSHRQSFICSEPGRIQNGGLQRPELYEGLRALLKTHRPRHTFSLACSWFFLFLFVRPDLCLRLLSDSTSRWTLASFRVSAIRIASCDACTPRPILFVRADTLADRRKVPCRNCRRLSPSG